MNYVIDRMYFKWKIEYILLVVVVLELGDFVLLIDVGLVVFIVKSVKIMKDIKDFIV